MAVETDKFGSKRYTSPRSDVVRVVPKVGQEYTITPLPTEHDGKPFTTHIFEPENPLTKDLTLVGYGLGENGGVGEGEAHGMAILGIRNALHDTPRSQETPDFCDILKDPSLLKDLGKNALNPLILPSEAISEVANTAHEYNEEYENFYLKVRSMGGLTGSMIAARDERVKKLYMDAPAGIVKGNAFKNHVTGLKGIATEELPPAIRGVMKYASRETMRRIVGHFRDNPLLFGREIVFLVAKTPDVSALLETAHKRGTEITVVNHELDRFFPDQAMVRAITALRERGIVDRHYRSIGTRHVFGIEQPLKSAELYRDLIITPGQESIDSPELMAASH